MKKDRAHLKNFVGGFEFIDGGGKKGNGWKSFVKDSSVNFLFFKESPHQGPFFKEVTMMMH